MKIDSSNIGMESARSYRASNTTIRRFVIKDYQKSLAQGGNSLNAAVQGEQEKEQEGKKTEKDSMKTENSGNTITEWQNRFQMSAGKLNIHAPRNHVSLEIHELSLRYIFEMLFAARRNRLDEWLKENRISQSTADTSLAEGSTPSAEEVPTKDLPIEGAQNLPNISGPGVPIAKIKVLNYTQEAWQMEQESTSFSTVGTVRTADGREIHFNVDVSMSREFQEYYREDLELASFQMCDPLVINLDTDVASLSDQKFFFDIDADGELDEISMLGQGSGYLALDKNGDGVINDGSELFGTASGNGFKDLAQYDEDGNGWIDENDAIWSKLKIWSKDENGNDILYRLADKGVGAICLQNVSTDFALKGQDNQTNGAIRNTGVFLYENGNVGTVQHVDVAKYAMEA